ncbi:MAG TPA: cupin domain-containing protein [Solirubrobacteraceae bacterium]|nr:cupin domain-containing protein [Solirubrobacteraceae bacterium]
MARSSTTAARGDASRARSTRPTSTGTDRDAVDSTRSRTARIGPRLRALRAARGLTIEQVADGAGVTKGFVSRVERDQTSISVAALLRICEVLQTPIGALFEDPPKSLVRAGEAPVIDFGVGRMRQLVCTPANVKDLRVIKLLLAPGADAGEEAYSGSRGTDFFHVVKGKLELELDGDSFVLDSGDSITFPSRTPHTLRNASQRERCEALVVFAPAP